MDKVTDAVTFARTQYNYDSYTDFWELVRLSGFNTVFLNQAELDNPSKIYIVSPANGELEYVNRAEKKAKLLLWNLERPGENGIGGYVAGSLRYQREGYIDGIIVSDRHLAKQTGFMYAGIGGHPALGSPGLFMAKKYDMIHLSCYSNHRGWLFDEPTSPKNSIDGYRVATNEWGVKRDLLLKASKYMLNVHQWADDYYVEPLRFTLAACYGLPIITEFCYDYWPYDKYVLPMDNVDDYLAAYSTSVYSLGLEFRNHMCFTFSFLACMMRWFNDYSGILCPSLR